MIGYVISHIIVMFISLWLIKRLNNSGEAQIPFSIAFTVALVIPHVTIILCLFFMVFKHKGLINILNDTALWLKGILISIKKWFDGFEKQT